MLQGTLYSPVKLIDHNFIIVRVGESVRVGEVN